MRSHPGNLVAPPSQPPPSLSSLSDFSTWPLMRVPTHSPPPLYPLTGRERERESEADRQRERELSMVLKQKNNPAQLQYSCMRETHETPETRQQKTEHMRGVNQDELKNN